MGMLYDMSPVTTATALLSPLEGGCIIVDDKITITNGKIQRHASTSQISNFTDK